jgi:hypothetical protein
VNITASYSPVGAAHYTNFVIDYGSNSVYWLVTMYINITTTILDIIQRPVVYLKPNVSQTGFCHYLQVVPTQLNAIDRD